MDSFILKVEWGWELTEEALNESMAGLWLEKFASKYHNIERLLFDPEAAMVYCWLLKRETKITATNSSILLHLTNLRKNYSLEKP